jgi:hypothetical protein
MRILMKHTASTASLRRVPMRTMKTSTGKSARTLRIWTKEKRPNLIPQSMLKMYKYG